MAYTTDPHCRHCGRAVGHKPECQIVTLPEITRLTREVESQCLLNAKGAQRESDLMGKVGRLEKEVDRLTALLKDVVNYADDRVAWSPRLRRNIDAALAPAAQGTVKHAKNCAFVIDSGYRIPSPCTCGATDTQGAAKCRNDGGECGLGGYCVDCPNEVKP
jgi:hypothetical protein